ncbi:hypothetical protein [Actinomadura rubrisoli]|uniref:Uncharacterized protein n=1 Tax=Actinomadura rubrisoli TaxID=2530368 RepID=A0A4R5BND5_9ACTN|nr:hypothetical protein [Actinomadura rubrisoli]TDD88358.1 hypothetical protein E1298_15220 [Actinomadura rubrisoli]
MAAFTIPAERFPWSPVQIRTRLGLVDFVDHRAEVDDEDLAAALREVPEVFGIVEEGAEPLASNGDGEGEDDDEKRDEPAEESATKPPSVRASKAEWVAYAVNCPQESKRLSEADAEAMTKADLVELYGG